MFCILSLNSHFQNKGHWWSFVLLLPPDLSHTSEPAGMMILSSPQLALNFINLSLTLCQQKNNSFVVTVTLHRRNQGFLSQNMLYHLNYFGIQLTVNQGLPAESEMLMGFVSEVPMGAAHRLKVEDPKPADAMEMWLISKLRLPGITSAQGLSYRPSVLGGCLAAEVTCIEMFVFFCSAISISHIHLNHFTSMGCCNSILYPYSTGSEGFLVTNCCHPQTKQNPKQKFWPLTLFLLRVWRKPSAPWTGSFPALPSASTTGMSSGMSCTCTPCTSRTRWGSTWHPVQVSLHAHVHLQHSRWKWHLWYVLSLEMQYKQFTPNLRHHSDFGIFL